ncbi:MAG: OmpA family protein [Phycisphaeraceae bacterium]|nr:OmpA family protein [Phycisphaeraceae bacterium]
MQGIRGLLAVVALACVVVPMTGCNKRLINERNALYAQNTELQDELNRCRAAMDSSEGGRSSLMSQISSLQNQLSVERSRPPVVRRVPVAVPTPVANGFASIAGVETEIGNGTITVRVPGDVLFPSGKTSLRSAAQGTLDKIASVIRRDYASKTIRVEGYTDTDPIRKSKWQDNLDLSLARAAAVHRYLQKKGVAAKKLEAVGMGQWHSRSSKAKSRRVEIIVVLND